MAALVSRFGGGRFGGLVSGRIGGPLWCADSMAALVGRFGEPTLWPHW